MRWFIQRAKSSLSYGLYLLLIIVLTDVILFKHILGLGYPSHYQQENIERYPAPYIEFTGKPNALDHNEFGFRGKSFSEADSGAIKVAFFGGSTGYNGSPPISEILELELEKLLKKDVFIANLSVVSSNHRQHLHAILEYAIQHQPDIIVFYGGYNETIQHLYYDPRPGYPFNYFYRGELTPFKKLLLKHSALVGEMDMRLAIISGLRALRSEHKPWSKEWSSKIVQKYFETLRIAQNVSHTIESSYFENCQFFAFYQPYQIPSGFLNSHQQIKGKISKVSYIHDVSHVYDSLNEKQSVYKDGVHVKQPARELMGKTMAQILFDKLEGSNAYKADYMESLR